MSFVDKLKQINESVERVKIKRTDISCEIKTIKDGAKGPLGIEDAYIQTWKYDGKIAAKLHAEDNGLGKLEIISEEALAQLLNELLIVST